MKQPAIIRDERYFTVENASYKIGFLILSFGTMLLISIRGFLYKESHWDFFALVWFSNLAALIYQVRHKILPLSMKSFYLMIALILVGSAVAAAAMVLLKTYLVK